MKKVIMLGMVIGFIVGSYIPLLWGGNVFSLASVLFGAVGGFAGIWAGYKMSSRFF